MNAAIHADLPITEEFLSRAEAEVQYDLERLPECPGLPIRIIRIGGYDACPCAGPHVKTTAEVGIFRIVSTTWEEGTLRVRFKLDPPPHNQ